MHTQLPIEQPACLFWEFEKYIPTSNPLIFLRVVIFFVKINKSILFAFNSQQLEKSAARWHSWCGSWYKECRVKDRHALNWKACHKELLSCAKLISHDYEDHRTNIVDSLTPPTTACCKWRHIFTINMSLSKIALYVHTVPLWKQMWTTIFR